MRSEIIHEVLILLVIYISCFFRFSLHTDPEFFFKGGGAGPKDNCFYQGGEGGPRLICDDFTMYI